MNKIYKTIGLSLVFAFVLMACNNTTTETKQKAPVNTGMHKALVEEVLQTSVYTYILFAEKDDSFWIAIPKRDVKAGEIYFFKEGLEMPDFKSKELNRTFEKVYFVEEISDVPLEKKTPAAMQKPAGKKEAARGVIAKIDHSDDEISLAQIFADKEAYANKTVKVRGTVVKVNENIMGKNWIHIQDGTESNGQFDLTITTKAAIKLGSVIGFEGIIRVNKDFGSGYKYDVIMEDALAGTSATL